MHSYNPDLGRFDSWALTIGQRTIRRHASVLRERPDQPEAVEATEPIDRGPSSEQLMSEAQLDAILMTLVELLPDALREVFIMADLEETSMRTIARELGITQRSGYARLSRARKLMARGLRPYQRDLASALPLGFLTLDRLVEVGRKTPPVDPALKARVRDRVARDLASRPGAGLTGPAALAAGKPLVGPAAFKAAAGVSLFAAGMGVGALLYWASSDSPHSAPMTISISDVSSPSVALPVVSAPLSVLAPPSTPVSSARVATAAPRSSMSPARVSAGALADEDSSVAERALIQGVRLSLRENDPERALVDLRRHRTQFKNPQLADIRDDLWRQAMDMSEAKRRSR
jgi:RNA polymerase sigma factor (sigma-70 family)